MQKFKVMVETEEGREIVSLLIPYDVAAGLLRELGENLRHPIGSAIPKRDLLERCQLKIVAGHFEADCESNEDRDELAAVFGEEAILRVRPKVTITPTMPESAVTRLGRSIDECDDILERHRRRVRETEI